MTEHNPLIERYMSRFEDALQQYKLPEWREIAADLRSHIAEALAYGKPIDDVLNALGGADVMARAYAVELAINPPRTKPNWIIVALKVGAIVAATGMMSFLVVVGLGSVAMGFTASGLALIVICLIEAMGTHLPGVQMAGMHPLVVMLFGPPMLLLGIGAGWALWLYMRFIVRALRKAIPRAAA
jgi:uncharacterized membrane protein